MIRAMFGLRLSRKTDLRSAAQVHKNIDKSNTNRKMRKPPGKTCRLNSCGLKIAVDAFLDLAVDQVAWVQWDFPKLETCEEL